MELFRSHAQVDPFVQARRRHQGRRDVTAQEGGDLPATSALSCQPCCRVVPRRMRKGVRKRETKRKARRAATVEDPWRPPFPQQRSFNGYDGYPVPISRRPSGTREVSVVALALSHSLSAFLSTPPTAAACSAAPAAAPAAAPPAGTPAAAPAGTPAAAPAGTPAAAPAGTPAAARCSKKVCSAIRSR